GLHCTAPGLVAITFLSFSSLRMTEGNVSSCSDQPAAKSQPFYCLRIRYGYRILGTMNQAFFSGDRLGLRLRAKPTIAFLLSLLLTALGTACSGNSVNGAPPQADPAIPVKIQ